MSGKTSVKVTTFSTGLCAVIFWVLGYYQPELMSQLSNTSSALIVGFVAVITGWITPNPND